MATKKERARRRSKTGPTPSKARPKVHASVVAANMDLTAANRLVRPALLYADSVTVYSPAASLITSVSTLAAITSPADRLSIIFELAKTVPGLGAQINATPEQLEGVLAIAAMSESQLRQVGQPAGSSTEISGIKSFLQGFDEMWDGDVQQAVSDAVATTGGSELLAAVESGLVNVAPLGSSTDTETIAETLRLASGDRTTHGTDGMLEDFVERLGMVLQDDRSFALLDADSVGLAPTLRQGSSNHSGHRLSEIGSAAAFMGYLPDFDDMRLDEAADLRSSLETPLVRFRGAVSRLSHEFESTPLDAAFDREVEDAWRATVEPALAEIREGLAEHGLLRSARSVALGDPRRLMAEAGGVLALTMGSVMSLSSAASVAAAAAVPALDLAGRSVAKRSDARLAARTNAFYFLHALSDR